MCIIQKRTKDNSLTVFNPVEGLNMDNNFKDYVKDESQLEDDLYHLKNAVKDAEFYVNIVENNLNWRISTKDIPKPLRKRIKKLGIDL